MAQGYVLTGLCNVDHKIFHIWRKTSASEAEEHRNEQRKWRTTILVPQNQTEVVPVYTIKEYGAVEVQLHLSLTSIRVIGQLQAPVDFPPGKGPRKYLNRGPNRL